MRLPLAALALAILAAIPARLSGAAIADMDESHPAYEIVLHLVEEGYLPLYEGDEFRADMPMTRLEVALLVDRMLRRVAEGTVTPTEMDAQALRLLAEEFRAEIIRVDDRLFAFESRLRKLEDEQPQIVADVVSLRRDVESQLLAFSRELASLRAALDGQESVDTDATTRLDALEMRLADLEARLLEVEEKKKGGSMVTSNVAFWLVLAVGAAVALG